MVLLSALLAMSVVFGLVFYQRTQTLQRENALLQGHISHTRHASKESLRVLRASMTELQNQLLSQLSQTQLRGVLSEHEYHTLGFLLSHLCDVVVLCTEKQLPVSQALQLIGKKQQANLSSLQLFVQKQSADVVSAWQLNQVPAFISVCVKLSRFKAHIPAQAQAS